LEEEGEEGMIHSLLSSFPNIADDALDEEKVEDPKVPAGDPISINPSLVTVKLEDDDGSFPNIADDAFNEEKVEDPKVPAGDPISINPSLVTVKLEDDDGSFPNIAEDAFNEEKVEDPKVPAGDPISINPSLVTVKLEDDDDEKPLERSVGPKIIKLFLTDLLKHADTLYNTFPPSHPDLSLSSIMGPQSVIFTWSESFSSLPSDNTAEAMVSRPELVVYPFIETQMISKESSKSEEKTNKKTHRKRHKSPFSHMEKKTMVAGTVIVLGVAMAIYGVKASRTGDRSVYGLFHNFAGRS
jgi:TBC1 domain family member 20